MNMAAFIIASETFKFLTGIWLSTRSVFKAIVIAFEDSKKTAKESQKDVGIDKDHKLPEKLPTAVEIKRALPKHCFQPCTFTSIYYAFKDAFLVLALYTAIGYLQNSPHFWIRAVSLPVYWFVQGTVFFAIFVVGHDCGHESFSNSSLLNDTFGVILHSFLMVPYYQWKLSHKHHHKNTGNIDKDEVFYPMRKTEQRSKSSTLYGFAFGFGWWTYLLIGYGPRTVVHLNLFDPMFRGHLFGCFTSLVSIALWVCGFYKYANMYGFLALFNFYLVPLFVFATYVVVVTFLHHSEENVPWYSDHRWDFVRGQLSSVDRHYGLVHNLIHNIGTHQIHHMFSKIPHYHLEEATVHFRQAFPHLVRKCHEPILPSFTRMFKKYATQSIIEPDCEIHAYE